MQKILALIVSVDTVLLVGAPGPAYAECFANRPEQEWPKPADFVITVPWTTEREVEVLQAYDSGHHRNRKECHRSNDYYAIDFNLNNEEVAAVADGEVEYAGSAGGGWASYGVIIFIKHRDDFSTLYAHLKEGSLRVSHTGKVKDKVQAGQVIATSGDTGDPGDPHLHFAMYYRADFQRDPAGPYGGLTVKPEPFRGAEEYTNIVNGKKMRRAAGGAAKPILPPATGPGASKPEPNLLERWLAETRERVERQRDEWVADWRERVDQKVAELQAWLQQLANAWAERLAHELAAQLEKLLAETCGAALLALPTLVFALLRRVS